MAFYKVTFRDSGPVVFSAKYSSDAKTLAIMALPNDDIIKVEPFQMPSKKGLAFEICKGLNTGS